MSSLTSDVKRPTPTRQKGAGLLLAVLCGVQFIDAFEVASMGPALPKINKTSV